MTKKKKKKKRSSEIFGRQMKFFGEMQKDLLKEAFNRSDVGVLLKIKRAENNRLERAVGKSRCSVYCLSIRDRWSFVKTVLHYAWPSHFCCEKFFPILFRNWNVAHLAVLRP